MKLTGSMNTDALLYVKCPVCNAIKGANCRTPAGKSRKDVHKERKQELMKLVPVECYTADVDTRRQLLNEQR